MRDATKYCGVLNLYKPAKITSYKAVEKAKNILRVKKAGHAGTLDPNAEGVLPIFVGKATAAFNYLKDEKKEYKVEFILGVSTDTCDYSGRIEKFSDKKITMAQIKKVIPDFEGDIIQKPPIYSAIKVKGKRLYEYARSGNFDVEIPKRKITIDNIKLIGDLKRKSIVIEDKKLPVSYFYAVVSCSRGTYIRSLCRDLAVKLGTRGCMGSLIRTLSGPYTVENSVSLSKLDDFKEFLPVADLFNKYEKITLNHKQMKQYINGNYVLLHTQEYKSGNKVAVYTLGHGFIGIGNISVKDDSCYVKGEKMFCNPFI